MVYNRNGLSLIEMVVTILVVGILAACGAAVLMYVVRNAVFIPNQINMNMMASDALDLMIEGDTTAPGLRFSRAITDIQDNQVTYIYRDQLGANHTVVFQFNPVTSRLSRSIDGQPALPIPYYIKPGISLLVKNNRLFTYYDSAEPLNMTATPADVRWITMTLVAQTGTGSSSNWEGQSEQMSSVAVYRFQ